MAHTDCINNTDCECEERGGSVEVGCYKPPTDNTRNTSAETEVVMQTVIANIVDEEELVKTAVDRFLSWKIPQDFSPDAGITFSPGHITISSPLWPSGTNLLDSAQAEQMVRHMLGLST